MRLSRTPESGERARKAEEGNHANGRALTQLAFLGPAIVLVAVITLLSVCMLLAVSQAMGGFDSEVVSKLSQEYGSREVLQLLGIGIASAVLIRQSLIANRRARAIEEASAAQAGTARAHATANLNTEKGQRQERLKNAIEHLGSNSGALRLGWLRALPPRRGDRIASADGARHPLCPYSPDDKRGQVQGHVPDRAVGGNSKPLGPAVRVRTRSLFGLPDPLARRSAERCRPSGGTTSGGPFE